MRTKKSGKKSTRSHAKYSHVKIGKQVTFKKTGTSDSGNPMVTTGYYDYDRKESTIVKEVSWKSEKGKRMRTKISTTTKTFKR